MSSDILELSLILRSKIMERVNKKKRKLSLLLAGGCLSCKRSKRDEEKLTEETEEVDLNQADKDYGTEKTETDLNCSTTNIEKKLKSDTIKNFVPKDNDEATCSSTSENIANESLKQYSFKKIEERVENSLLTELPFGTDLCSESNENVNDLCLKDFPNKEKKKKFNHRYTRSLKEEKKDKKRPNYFVAIQVSNPEIKESIKNIQNHIIKKETKLKSTIINVKTLHITLLVFHISSNEDLERAISALSKCYEILKEEFTVNPLQLSFEGLDNFNNKVIFVKVNKDALDRLNCIAEEVVKSFEFHNVEITDKRKFSPHLTILKLSKDSKLWKKGIKKVDTRFYDEFKNEHFGLEVVKGLQLLEMKRKDDNGYYHCCKEFLFEHSTNRTDESDEKLKESPQAALQREKENVRKKISALTESQLKKL